MLSSILMMLLAAELPRVMIDTSYTPAACDVTITEATSLQDTINNATCGQTICLTAGDTWTGNWTIPDKSCTDTSWVVIRTSTPDSALPANRRVAPADVAKLATLSGSTHNFVSFLSGADHYRFVGIEFVGTSTLNSMISVDDTATEFVNHVIFDRVYVHGVTTTTGTRNGIFVGGEYISVIDSYISDIAGTGSEPHGFLAVCGIGPYKIYNTRVRASGSPTMFGGGGCGEGYGPQDIYIARNHFDKPVEWATGYTGKNLFEIKAGDRVLVENNLMENTWSTMSQAQTSSVNLKASDDNACCQWITTRDVTFRNNLIRHAHAGISWSGFDGTTPSGIATRRFDITNNLFYDIGTTWDSAVSTPKASQIMYGHFGPSSFSHNTFQIHDSADNAYVSSCDEYSIDIAFDYNIFTATSYGVKLAGYAIGNDSIVTCFHNTAFTGNVLVAQNCTNYPVSTACPAADSNIGFVNLGGDNFRLDSSSAYDQVAPGGRDTGAFVAAAGNSWLDLEVQQSGTSAILRFGRDGLAADATCTVRKGATEVASTSGGARREVVVTGLTNLQSYYFSVDCGDQDGDIDEVLYTAATPSGGDRTIPIQLPAPPSILTGAARATLDYDDNAGLSSPTNTQNTSCGSGCTINLVAPAGVQYYRWRWQNASDTVLATSAVQPLLVQ